MADVVLKHAPYFFNVGFHLLIGLTIRLYTARIRPRCIRLFILQIRRKIILRNRLPLFTVFTCAI